jgi:hypothetical protein
LREENVFQINLKVNFKRYEKSLFSQITKMSIALQGKVTDESIAYKRKRAREQKHIACAHLQGAAYRFVI